MQPAPQTSPAHVGGSFAPPVTADMLQAYRGAAVRAEDPVREAVEQLCDMVELFQQTGPSRLKGSPHPSGRGLITPLEQSEVERIWDAVPWPHEADALQRLFDGLPSGTAQEKALRNAAFHLLWFAVELGKDREPLTADRL